MATVRIQLRRGTSSQWDNADPILAAGEIGIETDTNTFKFGDGVTAWSSLNYALSDTVDDYIPLSEKGVALGVATLDASGFVPSAQLPPLAKVTVSAVANQAARLALTVEPGDIAIQSDNGTTYVLQSSPASTDANWKEISATAAISAAVSAHEADTTNIHGIVDTALLATKAYADQAETDAKSYTDDQINLVLGAAPAALNTLDELAAALNDDANFASTVTNSLSLKAPLASPVFTGTVSLPASTDIGNVSSTEIAYLDGVTSTIQGQIDSKLATATASSTYAPLASPTFTGTVTLPGSTSIGDVSNLELGYLNGVTSDIQGQIDSKLATATASSTYAPLASPTFTGTVTLPGSTSIGDVNSTELGYVNGVTSPLQTQLDSKAPLASPTFTGTVTLPNNTVTGAMIADLTIPTGKIADTAITAAKLASSAVETAKINDAAVTTAKINDGAVTSAKIADGTIVNADINASAAIDWTKLAISSTVSSTELGYVDGVTSAIQTQLDEKAPLASPTFTGTVSGITKSMVGLGNVDNTSDANKPVSTATQTALDAKLSLSGGTMTGALTLSGAPSSDLHAATKAYVDNVTAGLNFHQPVRVATTANITLSGTQTIDGVSLSAGDRVLVKDQTTQTQNGIYVVASGSWTRATDADNTPDGELKGGDFTLVLEGTVNSGYGYVCSNTSAITIGTTNVTYAAFNAAKAVTAGSGLTESTPGTIDIATNGVTSAMIADGTIVDGDISSSAAITKTKISGTAITAADTGTVTSTMILDGTIVDADINASAAIAQSKVANLTTDLAAKAPLASPTFTGTVTVAASGIAFTDGTQTKEGVPSRTTINSATGAYNLSTGGLALRDTLIECNSGSAFTVTIPANSTTAYPVGTSIDLLQTGAGQITVAPAAGVTLNGTPGLKLRTQWSSATLFKRATDTWVIMGDLTA